MAYRWGSIWRFRHDSECASDASPEKWGRYCGCAQHRPLAFWKLTKYARGQNLVYKTSSNWVDGPVPHSLLSAGRREHACWSIWPAVKCLTGFHGWENSFDRPVFAPHVAFLRELLTCRWLWSSRVANYLAPARHVRVRRRYNHQVHLDTLSRNLAWQPSFGR